MNLINLLAVLLVCLYQGGVEGVQVKRCPGKDRYFPVGRVPDERSVTLTIHNVSAGSEPTVSLVGGREETVITSLMRAADSDSRFSFLVRYTDVGLQLTGFGDLTNSDDGNWEVVQSSKDGSEVTITSGLDSVVTSNGDRIVFNYRPVVSEVPTMEFKQIEYFVPDNCGSYTVSKVSFEVTVIRTGDLTRESSVICYTEDDDATAGEDYIRRLNGNTSKITFSADESEKLFEVVVLCGPASNPPNGKKFMLRLGSPSPSPAVLGSKVTALVTLAEAP